CWVEKEKGKRVISEVVKESSIKFLILEKFSEKISLNSGEVNKKIRSYELDETLTRRGKCWRIP
ncbi:hypothetical protein HAX54_029404, partial [Datura stramonium]|nr:hypothetical protein [Datura stramonium]